MVNPPNRAAARISEGMTRLSLSDGEPRSPADRSPARLERGEDRNEEPEEIGMKKLLSAVLFASVMVGSLAAAAPPALAEEVSCSGSLGAITVDNLRVPQDASCTLNGTRIQGTLKVERNAALNARNINVVGNVQGENHRSVVVTDSTVGGSVQFDQGGFYRVINTDVTGTIAAKQNSGASRLARTDINQDVQVFNHQGGIAIANNAIDGNLQCKENVPAPTGSGNVVQGNKEDQCSGL